MTVRHSGETLEARLESLARWNEGAVSGAWPEHVALIREAATEIAAIRKAAERVVNDGAGKGLAYHRVGNASMEALRAALRPTPTSPQGGEDGT